MSRTKETIDIEQLLEWAYRVECIDTVRGRAMLQHAGPLPPRASSLMSVVDLGCRIDVPGRGAQVAGVEINEDAWSVDRAVMELEAEPCVSVITHGRLGTRPDWLPDGVGRKVPARDGRGRIRKMWADRRYRNREIVCLVRNTGHSWACVQHARAQYRLGHQALSCLCESLCDGLERFAPTGPAAPTAPWSPQNSEIVIFDELSA